MGRMKYIHLKAARALEHLQSLKADLQLYYDSSPCTVTKFSRPEIGRRGFRIAIADPDDRIYLLAGDFAHNLRSALDHVVYALIVHTTKELPGSTQVQWPVQTTENATGAKTFERQTKGVPPAPLAVIAELQPYAAGPGEAYKRTPLWQLHKLDIVDKHRRIAMNQHSILSHFPSLGKSSDVKKEIVDGHYEIHFPIDAPLVEMQYIPEPEILFGDEDEGLRVSVERLNEISVFVCNDVLPRFESFLA
jgi:hypothetical protein